MFNIIQYRKRNNDRLFKNIKDVYNIDGLQNYIPIYKSIFNLSENNHNKINLNTDEILEDFIDNGNAHIMNIHTNEIRSSAIHIKFAPILDPFRFIMGKYVDKNDMLYNLPIHLSENDNILPKVSSSMNSAYTDSLFYYLTTKLLEKYNFIHGVKCYGTFIGIQNNYKFTINDDLEYLSTCKYFTKNSNKLFKVDDYTKLLSDCSSTKSSKKKEHLNIDDSIITEDIDKLIDFTQYNFEDTTNNSPSEIIETNEQTSINIDSDSIDICEDYSNNNGDNDSNGDDSESSESSESSVSSGSNDSDDSNSNASGRKNYDEDDESDVWEDESDEDEQDIDEDVYVTLDKFPITFICMEKCSGTLDKLIDNDYFVTDEMWYAMFMQLIMMLIVYQKSFSFTHNDLHTNNIMFIETEETYLYYNYNNTVYRVPTYGKVFKIIDFGRSIYKVNNVDICSDSYDVYGDAHTQYNCHPFFNPKKPIVVPNFSFDLCRLGTSIFDYLIMKPGKNENITRLVEEWCCDDKGKNVLYKSNGEERYPDFKLYKMIARTVHNHLPENQLTRECFTAFAIKTNETYTNMLNIDIIPSFFNDP